MVTFASFWPWVTGGLPYLARALIGVVPSGLILADSALDVKTALNKLTNLLIGYVGPVFALLLVFLGWQYLLASAAGDTHRAANLKWAILGMIGGALLVILAGTFGADIITALTPSSK